MPSPHPGASGAGMLPSPLGGSGGSGGVHRPPLMKRHSSQASHASGKHQLISPSSAGEQSQPQPLRHHVKTGRKTKLVLPRNNSSARNLAKLARHGSDTPKQGHARQKSQEGVEGIRLPGSLGESEPRPAIKRNLTSSHLPRNTSHTKLKKNLSHGQLARLGSGKNLQALAQGKHPPSPGLKGKSKKKRRSLDAQHLEKDLHEQEMEIARQQEEARQNPRRVGFAVGDGNDSSEEEDGLQMEGSGLQEDEWTDQSASASPATTRQNTANNSRRPSYAAPEKPPLDKSHLREALNAKDLQTPHYQENPSKQGPAVHFAEKQTVPEADGTPAASYESESDGEEDDPPSPRSVPQSQKAHDHQLPPPPSEAAQSEKPTTSELTTASTPTSLLAGAKDHPNPFTKQLLNRNHHNPAPALVSNVSAMDETRSARASPAASMRSSRSNIADQTPDQEGELISRFMPSASHPTTTSSGANTTANTPKIGSYQTPDTVESSLAARHRAEDGHININNNKPRTQYPPTSPGSSTLSASSSTAATPSILRSRTELRMANERAMAELEGAARPHLIIPAHKFDRRNESLKSYLQGGSGGESVLRDPESYTGRFTAVNIEYKVIQRFADPVGESLARLAKAEGARWRGLRARRPAREGKGSGGVAISGGVGSKSAVGLHAQVAKLGGSASPPSSESQPQQLGAKSASPAKSALLSSRSAVSVADGRRAAGAQTPRVKFTSGPPERRAVETHDFGSRGEGVGQDGEEGEVLTGADAIARQLWDAAGRSW